MAVEERDPISRLSDDRARVERHQGARTRRCRARSYFFLVVDVIVFARLLGVLMPAWPLGHDLHQGPARHSTSATIVQQDLSSGRRPSARLDQADRDGELSSRSRPIRA